MKRNLISTVSIAALSLLISSNGAYAQTPARADVPFAFNVGSTHMPAGAYKIKRAVKFPFLDFSSGYVQRALDKLPKQGSVRPWKLYQNYALDLVTLRFGKVDDGTMEFTSPKPVKKAA